jgi:hypothetical protein
MNLPKRWIETESGSSPLERALLRPALDVEVPEGAEQRIWGAIVALAPLSAAGSAALGGAAAVEGSAAAAATASAGAGATTAIASTGVKLGLGVIVKAFAIGAASGTLLVGGLHAMGPERSSTEEPQPAAVAPISAAAPAGDAHNRRPSRLPAAAVPSGTAPVPPPPAARYPELPHLDPPTTEHATGPGSVSTFPSLPSPAPGAAKSSGTSPSANDPSTRLGDEARVLRRAREALREGNLGAAFAALEVARTEFPRGALGEEREALTIELLAQSGQRDAARARAAGFLQRFPGSAHAASVRRFAD